MALIEIRNLAKSFGSVRAVDGVDLDINAGEFLTLLGPSGSGKTTVLRMIAGFETPDSGSIKLNNIDITYLPPYERDVNTVFQDYALFPHMDVASNIEYGLRVKGIDKKNVELKLSRPSSKFVSQDMKSESQVNYRVANVRESLLPEL